MEGVGSFPRAPRCGIRDAEPGAGLGISREDARQGGKGKRQRNREDLTNYPTTAKHFEDGKGGIKLLLKSPKLGDNRFAGLWPRIPGPAIEE